MLSSRSTFVIASALLVVACRIGGDSPALVSEPIAAPAAKDAATAGGKLVTTVNLVPVADHRAEWRAFLADARRTQIARLREYRTRGEFPVNRVRPGMVNIFVDERTGALCAVANLIAASGNRALVDSTAAANNFVRVADMTSGPVIDWILTSGLTKEEAVYIQEPYMYQEPSEPSEPPPADDPPSLSAVGDLPATPTVSPRVAEKQRLRRHFVQVERRLEAEFETSLDLAMSRLPAAFLASAPPSA